MSGSGFQIGNHRAGRPRSDAVTSAGSWPTLRLDVPLVGQVRQMDCWYAGACMLAYYREAGPRLGLPRAWIADRGIQQPAWGRLARAEGLLPVPMPGGAHRIDQFGLFRWLMDYGPLWCAGDWFGFGHVIVVTGITGTVIHLNDPDDGVGGPNGARKTNTVQWFNDHLYWNEANCLLYRPA